MLIVPQKSLLLVDSYLRERDAPVVGASTSTTKKEFDRSVVIDTLLDPDAAKDHSVLDADQLAAEVIMLLSAGNDTTSNAMIVGIYQILKNPNVYKTLTDELLQSFPDGTEEITYDKAKKLPYLVRLKPIAGMIIF
jgi:cytochrome P450